MIYKALSLDDLPALTALLVQHPELNWTPEMLKDSLCAAQNKAFGLFLESQLVSFALLQVVLDEAELLLIATDTHYLRRGYAAQLLKKSCIQFKSIFLEVRISHIAAQQLYKKLNFKYQGIRKNYYSCPPEDAVQYRLFRL